MASSPSAVTFVFETYELLDSIVYWIYCPWECYDRGTQRRDYAALMRVNKLWFSVATKYVWRKLGGRHECMHGPWKPDLEILIEAPERLQIYARCVEELGFDDLYDCYDIPDVRRGRVRTLMDWYPLIDVLSTVDFPRLCVVQFNATQLPERGFTPSKGDSAWDRDYLYLRQSLKCLRYYYLRPTPEFYTTLKVRFHMLAFHLLYIT